MLALLGTFAAWAQPEPIKFGKPDPRDFTAAPFAGDSADAAIILCDYATARVELGTNGQLQSVFERTARIKILKKSGYQWATVEIPLFSSGQKLASLRGFTYNLVGGTVEKLKLEDEGKYVDEVTRYLRIRKFTMPNVREGSVIEFTYSIVSDASIGVPDWQFQHPIPARWSEYRITYPDYFDYRTTMRGYLPLAVREQSEGSMILGQKATRTWQYRWAMRDVPALRAEPYITTMNDYLARMDVDLAGVTIPGESGRSFTNSWERIESQMLQDENFGLQLDRGGFLKDALAGLPPVSTNTIEARVAAVHALVRDAVKYNDQASVYPSAPLRKIFQETHRGNAADINLLLIVALRAAGIEANPVLLSTRDHGRINVAQPLASRFNYVVAQVGLPGGQNLLLDATDPLLPSGMLPERCLNQTGRLVLKESLKSRWIDLLPSQRRGHYQQVQLVLTPEGGLSGKVHEEFSGYAGATARAELEKAGEPKYRAKFAGRHSSWTVPRFTISERTNLGKPLTLDYEFTQPDEGPTPGGTLYLNPLNELGAEQTPFLHETRLFPVDFGAPQEETLLITLSLPPDYELAETPKPAVVELPDGGGRFFFSVVVNGGALNITSRMILRKPVYAAEEYQYLREFYRLMLTKQAEKFSIRKKA